MKIAIVGSRDFTNYQLFSQQIQETINQWLLEFPNETVEEIVSGGARGTDTLASKWAKEHNIKLTVFNADWNKYKNAAGPMRNTQIIDRSTHVIAFPSSTGTGTQDSIRKAEKAKKTLKIFSVLK